MQRRAKQLHSKATHSARETAGSGDDLSAEETDDRRISALQRHYAEMRPQPFVTNQGRTPAGGEVGSAELGPVEDVMPW
jgi:hypothetical protein